jgi:hypothetical protein
MSELQLRPEFETTDDDDTVHGLTALNRAADTSEVPGGAQRRGMRRRRDAARLRVSNDDGFRLFRVY